MLSCRVGWSPPRLCCWIVSRAEAPQVDTQAVLLLVGGPAGAGKSTVATAWCHTRQRAVRIDLDEVRDLIIAGQADRRS